MGTTKNLKWVGLFVLFLALWAAWHSFRSRHLSSTGPHVIPTERHASGSLVSDNSSPPSPSAGAVRNRNEANARPKEEIMRDLHDASVTYDPNQLPMIRHYLSHPDPSVRTAAANAMVILGDASAAPMLREAAAALSPDEAKSFIKKADYLELPPAAESDLVPGQQPVKP